MKWNWGSGIFLFIVFFIGACILFLVYASKQKWSMVEDDYYARELRHEDKLVMMRNANALAMPLQARVDNLNPVIEYPSDLRGKTLTGNVHIYRPSDEDLDINIPVVADSSMTQVVPLSRLKHGRYVLKVDWTAGDKKFYKELDVFIP